FRAWHPLSSIIRFEIDQLTLRFQKFLLHLDIFRVFQRKEYFTFFDMLPRQNAKIPNIPAVIVADFSSALGWNINGSVDFHRGSKRVFLKSPQHHRRGLELPLG